MANLTLEQRNAALVAWLNDLTTVYEKCAAERDRYRRALAEIHEGAQSNAGRCLDCDTINSIACLALRCHNNAPQEG